MKLLDTDVCILFLVRGDPEVVARLQAEPAGSLRLCSVVKAEMLTGVRKSQRVAENLRNHLAFFMAFESLPFDDAAAEQYGILRADLERQGRPIGANDMMIAATALAHDCCLVTRNGREFARVPGLAIERW